MYIHKYICVYIYDYIQDQRYKTNIHTHNVNEKGCTLCCKLFNGLLGGGEKLQSLGEFLDKGLIKEARLGIEARNDPKVYFVLKAPNKMYIHRMMVFATFVRQTKPFNLRKHGQVGRQKISFKSQSKILKLISIKTQTKTKSN